jgi:hypothetical protein
MPNTRPRISIDENGYCNGCTYNNNRRSDIDWAHRKLELKKIISQSKNELTNDTYDCVIGWSGGKDSSAIALGLKNELGLNPLLVTFSPLIPTPEGEFNRRALQSYGFDSILVSPDIKVSKHLSHKQDLIGAVIFAIILVLLLTFMPKSAISTEKKIKDEITEWYENTTISIANEIVSFGNFIITSPDKIGTGLLNYWEEVKLYQTESWTKTKEESPNLSLTIDRLKEYFNPTPEKKN